MIMVFCVCFLAATRHRSSRYVTNWKTHTAQHILLQTVLPSFLLPVQKNKRTSSKCEMRAIERTREPTLRAPHKTRQDHTTRAFMRTFFIAASLVFAQSAESTVRPAPESTVPHIMYILADDFGWADADWHRTENWTEKATPNLMRLIQEGVELDQHYTFKFCS